VYACLHSFFICLHFLSFLFTAAFTPVTDPAPPAWLQGRCAMHVSVRIKMHISMSVEQ
jgi:hypothetical protein